MEDKIMKILIADDEPDILKFLQYNLEKEGYEVITAVNGKEAIEKSKKESPDLIILDIMMPELDGVEACRELRQLPEFKDSIIAFLTARGEDYSQIAGFEVGADDYITKPIKPRVFIARIKALLKRKLQSDTSGDIINIGGLKIDKEKRLIFINKKTIQLPKKEFELLILLTSKPGKVFFREEIYSNIWGLDNIVSDRTLDVHIRKLREFIGENYIKTVKGVGYKFDF